MSRGNIQAFEAWEHLSGEHPSGALDMRDEVLRYAAVMRQPSEFLDLLDMILYAENFHKVPWRHHTLCNMYKGLCSNPLMSSHVKRSCS